MSRPSEYTPEVTDRICARLAAGESLRSVCRDDSMPCVATVFNWMRSYPAFLEQYARAKEESADALTDEMLEIADNETGDVQRDRLKVDTRKWLASKLKPKKYGEKVEHQHAGSGGGPIVHRVELVDLAAENGANRAAPKA